MMTCDRCQQLLLDHAYGLLEGSEAEALEHHLQQCSRCRAAHRQAQHWQQLLAAAARDRFAHVRFQPPTALPVTKQPSVRPVATTTVAARCLSWSVAAAIWLIGPLLLLTWKDLWQQLQSARQQWESSHQAVQLAEQHWKQQHQQWQDQVAQARRDTAAAEQLALGLLDRWLADTRQLQHTHNQRIEVIGPPRLQAGLANNLLLVLRDPNILHGGQLLAEIRDQNDAVLFSRRLDPEQQGDRQWLQIPARLWTRITPHSELFLVFVKQDDKTHQRLPLQEKVRLSGPVYITYLTTDRVRYRPGETVYFRSLTLDRVSWQPPPREQWLIYTLRDRYGRPVSGISQSGTTTLVQVKADGQVIPVRGPDDQPLRGVGCGAFVLPTDLADGEYFLEVREYDHPAGYAAHAIIPARCVIQVERGASERLAKQLDFSAASFVPGGWVEARAQAFRDHRPASRIPVEAWAWVDGRRFTVEMLPHGHTDDQGIVQLRFQLPKEQHLPHGDVRLQVVFRTAEGSESLTRTVPVVGKQIQVEFFPEGGHLVAGVPCRVYVRARTPAGIPVDIRGTITDGRRELARVETFRDPQTPGVNRGLGSFVFTPELGRYYWLRLDEPEGVRGSLLTSVWQRHGSPATAALLGVAGALSGSRGYMLPPPQIDGVVLTVPHPVLQADEPLRVRLCSVGKPQRRLVVGAYLHGQLADMQTVTVGHQQWHEVVLLHKPQPHQGGVIRLTVYEDLTEEQPGADLRPVAERLVFRQGGPLLQLQARLHSTVGGNEMGRQVGSTELQISARDELGQPVPAVLYAAIVHSAQAPLPQHRLLTTHFLVAGEIQSPDALEYADFLLSANPQAPASLDLLLATQGWRRFRALPPPRGAMPLTPQAPASTDNPSSVLSVPLLVSLSARHDEGRWQLYQQYWPRYQQAMQQWEQSRQRLQAVENDKGQQALLEQLQLQILKQRSVAEQAQQQWQAAQACWHLWWQARWAIWGSGALLFISSLIAARIRWGQRLAWLCTASAVALILSVGTWLFLTVDATLQAAAPPAQPSSSASPLPPTGQKPASPVAAPAGATGELLKGNATESAQDAAPATAQTTSSGNLVDRGTPPIAPGNTNSVDAGGHGSGQSMLQTPTPVTNNDPGSQSQIMTGAAAPKAASTAPAREPWQRREPLHTYPLAPPVSTYPSTPIDRSGSLLPAPTQRSQHDPLSMSVKHPDRFAPGSLKASSDSGSDHKPPVPTGASPPTPSHQEAATGDNQSPMSRSQSRIHMSASPNRALQSPKVAALQVQFDTEIRQVQQLVMQNNQQRLQLLQQGWERKQSKQRLSQPQPQGERQTVASPDNMESTDQVVEQDVQQDRGWLQRAFQQLLQQMQFQPPPLIVREYASPDAAAATAGETLLWMPVIVLPSTGTIRIPLQRFLDAGSYDLIIAGHTLNGRIGALRISIPIPHAPPVPLAPPTSNSTPILPAAPKMP